MKTAMTRSTTSAAAAAAAVTASMVYDHAAHVSDDATSVCESQEEEQTDKSIAKGGVTTPFPWKLHDMLDDMAKEGRHSVVTWQPHGRAFMVHKPKDFVDDIMSHYFNQTKYASFQRQLNLYGFSRLSHGRDKGAYYHKCFVRGERNLCRGMIRQKIKGTKVRKSLSPEEEPNFYSPEWNKTERAASHPSTKPVSPSPRTAEQPAHQIPSAHLPLNSAIYTPAVTPPTKAKAMMDKVNLAEAPLRVVSYSHSDVSSCDPVSSLSLFREDSSRNKAESTSGVNSHVSHSSSINSMQSLSAKGGDLLFFEGLPFRYLEHLEELPPTPPQHASSASQLQHHHQRYQRQPVYTSMSVMESSQTNDRNCCFV